MAKKTPMDTVCRNLAYLRIDQLQETIELCRSILEIRAEEQAIAEQQAEREDEEEEEALQAAVPARVSRRKRGYREWKYINGCGPYLYWRVWDGKKLRPIYIGKNSA